MLNSSMISHRHCNVARLNSSRCFKLLLESLPVQFKPNAWCIVSPSNASAITAWKVTTWYCTPCFHPNTFSNNPWRSKLRVYDLPVPGPPCKTHRKGSSLLLASSERSSMRNSAAMRSATFRQNFFCSGLQSLGGSWAAQPSTDSGVTPGMAIWAVAWVRWFSLLLGSVGPLASGGSLCRNACFSFGISMVS